MESGMASSSSGSCPSSVHSLEDMFSSPVAWLLDSTTAFRFMARGNRNTSEEEGFRTEPINGAFGILNPRTGELFLKVVHHSEYSRLKKMAQLEKLPVPEVALLKVADDTAGLVRMLPGERQPTHIIANHKWMLRPLEEKLQEFPKIIVRGCKFQLPFLSFLDVDKLLDLIDQATESQSQRFFRINIYDDWLATIPSERAFWRLNLILRGYYANRYRTDLSLNLNQRAVTEPNHIWPSFTAFQWMNVEHDLSNLILSEYAIRHKVSASSLPKSIHERRDLLLGVETRQDGHEESDMESEMVNQPVAVVHYAPGTRPSSSTHNKRPRSNLRDEFPLNQEELFIL